MPCEVSLEVREFEMPAPTATLGAWPARTTPSWAWACSRRCAAACTPGLSRRARCSRLSSVASPNTVHQLAGRRALPPPAAAWRKAASPGAAGALKSGPTVVQPASASDAAIRVSANGFFMFSAFVFSVRPRRRPAT